MSSIEFELPFNKLTKGDRVKYGTEENEYRKVDTSGTLYPKRWLVEKAFGKVPARIKVTIEEVE